MLQRFKIRITLDELLIGIDQRSRIILGKAISVVESRLFEDQVLSARFLDEIAPKTGRSVRIGITGVPGVGKSTFIDTFGSYLTSIGKRVAVLTIDPSSTITKGSILGDKTRMERLSKDPAAFIRPSPSGDTIGGVASKTRETIALCEAFGYDIIIVETVGVGQSETSVHDMVDFFLLLMLSGGGDELQGIKRGIMEMADMLLINKADGDNKSSAKQSSSAYSNALHLFPPKESKWTVPVKTCSSTENKGIEEAWKIIEEYLLVTKENGYFEKRRELQKEDWLRYLINEELIQGFYTDPEVKNKLEHLRKKVTAGEISIRHAVIELFSKK